MVEQNKRVIRKYKPRHCPVVNSSQWDSSYLACQLCLISLEEDVRLGKTIIGGCVEFDINPTWQCSQCQLKIHKANFNQEAQAISSKEVIRYNDESTKQLIAKVCNHAVEDIKLEFLQTSAWLFNETTFDDAEEFNNNPDVICLSYTFNLECIVGAAKVAAIDIRRKYNNKIGYYWGVC